jgi:hypothetical protein
MYSTSDVERSAIKVGKAITQSCSSDVALSAIFKRCNSRYVGEAIHLLDAFAYLLGIRKTEPSPKHLPLTQQYHNVGCQIRIVHPRLLWSNLFKSKSSPSRQVTPRTPPDPVLHLDASSAAHI